MKRKASHKISKLRPATRKCVMRAFRTLKREVIKCHNLDASASKINKCLFGLRKVARRFSQKCHYHIRYHFTPVVAVSSRFRQKRGVLEEMRCKRTGVWDLLQRFRACKRKMSKSANADHICKQRLLKREKYWTRRCGVRVELELWRFCIGRARRVLHRYVRRCYTRHRGLNAVTKRCLQKGSSLAAYWSKKCGKRIRYKPRMPVVIKVKYNCKRKAYLSLRKYVRRCWWRYLGSIKDVKACLVGGNKLADQWRK